MQNIVKNTTIINPLDLIAPHSCRGCGRIGTVLCNRCKKYILSQSHSVCPNCKCKSSDGTCINCTELPPIFYIGERSGLLGDIIQNYKYYSNKALAKPLAELLTNTLPKFNDAVLVPLPTASHHIRSRGFDHTLLLAKNISKLTNFKTEKVLVRKRNTVQVGTNLKTRKTQADSAYSLADHFSFNNSKTYILIDDVWTTGATMKAAIKILRNAKQKNIAIALLAINVLN